MQSYGILKRGAYMKITGIKFTAKNFDEFYNRIKFVSTKYDESYPSKENAKLFFGKLFEHYKNISDKFLN